MKNKTKKWLSMLLAGALSIGAFVGCTPAGMEGNEDDDPNDTRTRLRISVYQAGFGIDWLKSIASEYEKENTDVKVVVTGDVGMEGLAQAAIETGGDGVSDIYSCISYANYYKNANFDANNDGESDRLVCMDDFYDEEIEEGKTLRDIMIPAFDKVVNLDGHYYGVPWDTSVTGIMYNVSMFNTHGWEVPETMEEFYTLCNQIKAKNIAPLGFSGGIADGYLSLLYGGLWAQIGGEEDIEEFFKFESAKVYQQESRLKAYETIGTIFGNTNWLLSGAKGMSNIEMQQAFLEGDCAMIICGSWFKTEMSAFLSEYPNFQCAMMPLPYVDATKAQDPNAKNGNLSQATMLVVPKEAKNPDIAKDFLKFMNTKKMLKMYTDKTNGNMRPFTYEGVDFGQRGVWEESLYNIFKNSYHLYPVSYEEQFRLGNLKELYIAGDGSICDEFTKCTSVAQGLSMAKSLWEQDYTIASRFLK